MILDIMVPALENGSMVRKSMAVSKLEGMAT